MSDVIEKRFSFFIPASVVKAEKDKDGKRWIQGVASTDHTDLQGEKVDQKGIEYDYFLKHGYINDDHKSGPEHKVGEPVEAKMTKDGFWIKGFLYKGKDRADHWWEHLNSLQQSGSKRRVGFSIQGKVQKRRGNRIEKCWIQDVAITASPVNTHTWAEIAKSLAHDEWEDKEGDEKALSTSSGAAMIPESLEGKQKTTTWKGLYPDFYNIPGDADLSYEDCVRLLQLQKGWSRNTAETVTDAIFIKKGNI